MATSTRCVGSLTLKVLVTLLAHEAAVVFIGLHQWRNPLCRTHYRIVGVPCRNDLSFKKLQLHNFMSYKLFSHSIGSIENSFISDLNL